MKKITLVGKLVTILTYLVGMLLLGLEEEDLFYLLRRKRTAHRARELLSAAGTHEWLVPASHMAPANVSSLSSGRRGACCGGPWD